MAANPEYHVDSYHINVEMGDGAIHLLLQLTQADGSALMPTRILSAVLIDGGHNRHMGLQNLKDTIQTIIDAGYADKDGNLIDNSDEAHCLKFDAIVVTHWDQDHWYGIVRLFMDDVVAQIDAGTPADTLECRYLRYNGPPGVGTGLPESVLYVPYWDFTPGTAATEEKGAYEGFSNLQGIGPAPAQFSLCDFDVEEHDGGIGRGTIPNFLKVRIHTVWSFLGINFFTGDEIDPAQVPTIAHPQQLIAQPVHHARINGEMRPGMYCIAAYRQYMGPVLLEVVDKLNTRTNQLSIAAMIIWPDLQLSHYFAGDLSYDMENKLVIWSGANGVGGTRVSAMKASHHGAATSTPVDLIENFDPRSIILSAGNDYGHPRWELLLYIQAWYLYNGYDVSDHAVWPICYPYYLYQTNAIPPVWVQTNPGKISPAAFRDDLPVHTTYRGYLLGIYERLLEFDVPVENPYALFVAAVGTADRQTQTTWLNSYVARIWRTISNISRTATPVTAFHGAANSILTGNNIIQYNLVQCRHGIDDGEVLIKVRGNPNLPNGTRAVPLSKPLRWTRQTSGQMTKTLTGPRKLMILSRNSANINLGAVTVDLNMVSLGDDPDPDEGDGPDTDDDEELVEKGDAVHQASKPVKSLKLSAKEATSALLSDPLPGYTFFCMELNEGTSPTTYSLGSGDLNDFITALHWGIITLVATPPATSDTTPISLFPMDEWNSWFVEAIGATGFTVNATQTNIISFNTTFSVPAVDSGNPIQATLVFDTSVANVSFDLPTPQALPPSGLLSGYDTMIFGLSPATKPVDLTLSDLFTFAGQDLPGKSLIGSLNGITLSLDSTNSRGDRNAIWFIPGDNYKTVVRLEPHLPKDALDSLNSFLKTVLPGFTVNTATVVAKKSLTYSTGKTGVKVVTEPQIFLSADSQITITPPPPKQQKVLLFTTTITFSPQSLDFVLQYNSGGAIGDTVDWIANLLGLENLPFLDWVDKAAAYVENDLQLRRISIKVGVTSKGLKVLSCAFDAQVTLAIGGDKDKNTKVAIKLSYTWPNGKFGRLVGALWPIPQPPVLLPRLDSDFEPFDEFNPITDGTFTVASTFNLENMYPDGSKLVSVPNQIPHNVCSAMLQIDSDGISFTGLISSNSPPPHPTVPTMYLDQVGLSASYTFGDESGTLSLGLSFTALLTPPSNTDWPVGLLNGSVNYTKTAASTTWALAGSLQDLNVAVLYSFFDSDTQDAAMQMMAKILIRTLSLDYNYSRTGDPSDFVFTGVLLLGDLELDLKYTYNDKLKRFSASLGSDSKQTSKVNLGAVLSSISDEITGLPSFVADVDIPSAANGGSVSVDYYKSTGSIGDFSIFVTTLQIEMLGFTFVQFSHASWPAGTKPKRIIRVAVRNLPDSPMPILGKLPQPFDEMDFIWVQDGSGQAAEDALPGFTVEEIGAINDELVVLNPIGADLFRAQNISSSPKPTDVVLKEGSHFLVIMIENNTPTVVLDYLLGEPEPPSAVIEKSSIPSGRLTKIKVRSMNITIQEPTPPTIPPTPPAMAPMKRSFGPLSISNVGLQYKDSSLWIVLDATLALGPIEFSLLGLGLGIGLGSGFSLTSFPDPEATISGLAVGFTEPPVVVAGLFEYLKQNNEEMYVGGVGIAFDPYLFLAAGGYGSITPAGAPSYDTVFLFAELDGPILDLEFIEISDICGGFGYNSNLTFPTATQVPTFPFIGNNMSGKVGTTPIDTIRNITDGVWINPKTDSLWFAVGLRAESFSILSIDAVVVIEFSSYVTLGIFADASAAIPQDDGNSGKLAFVEMGIAATVDFYHGEMLVQAELTPASFILDPDCHLTGGFALATWFGSNEHAGDWVFTLGGYHQAYKRPDHYPDTDRLAINWSLDGGLSITGNAYFAITPKVCMAGGLLQAHLSLGPLDAHYDAWADFLINYKPFNFVGDVGVSVGVSFSLDLLFVTIHIDVEIGASLHLTGLPIQGYVHVDFWVFGFDIYFGPSQGDVNPCSLETFWNLLLQQDKHSQARAIRASDPPPPAVQQGHTLVVESGLATGDGSQKSEGADVWNVRAGTFSFRVSTIFALQTVTLNAQPAIGSIDTKIYSRPMHITEDQTITSTMTITIAAEEAGEDTLVYGLVPVTKATPAALWDSYNSNNDPINPGNDTSDLLDGNTNPTIQQLMGLTIVAPPPTLSSDVIPAFSAVDAMSEIVSDVRFPTLTPSALPSWDPAPRDPVPASQWTDVHDAWLAPSPSLADFVERWAKAMKWVIPKEEELVPWPPQLNLENFDEVYMAAPCISVSS